MFTLLSRIKIWWLKIFRPQDFSGTPGPNENFSLRDGDAIIKARQSQGRLDIGSIDIARDGDRILIRTGTIAFWIDYNAGAHIGDLASEIKADRVKSLL